MPGSDRSEKLFYLGGIAAIALGLYLGSLYSYLLFHSLIEITTIAIGFTLFILAWNARKFLKNDFLVILGIGYAFIAIIDLLHALTYKGMGVFPGFDANLPTQLWIAARFLQAVTLGVAPLFVERRLAARALVGGYAVAVSVLVALVFSGYFPDCFIEGKGLTPFKIGSEYVITAMLLVSLYLFLRNRIHFNDQVFFLIFSSIVCTVLSEVSFTAYISVYGFANMVGHFCKLAAFFLIYRAILVTGLREPFDLIFKELGEAHEAIEKVNETLEEQVRARTAELRASEEKYRALFESANDIVFIHEITADGMPGPFLEVNELACKRLGYSKEELVRLSPLELDDPRYRDRIAAAMERIFKDGHAVFETAHMTKDGRSIPVEVSTRVVEFRGTSLLFSIARDITERKQAEQRLKTEHSLLRAILNSSQDIIIFALDKNYCYTAFNEKHRQEMKKVWDADIEIGQNLLACMRIAELRDLAKESIDRALHGEVFTEVQHQPEPDIYYEFIWNPVIQDKTIVGATVFILDITARKQTEVALLTSRETLHTREAELNEAQRLAHIGSWNWDAVHDTIWWSEEYYRVYGFDPTQPPPNYLEHQKAYTPESAARLDLVVQRAMESGEPYEIDLELARPTPGTRWIVARGEAQRDASGKIRGLRGTAQNITERKLAEQEIQRAKEELEQRVKERTAELTQKSSQLLASRQALMNLVDDLGKKSAELEHANTRLKELDQLKSMFIASMSHELRTPLNSIIGFSSIILDEWLGALNEEQKKNLATVLRSGKHLLALINDVIDVSKIEAGKLEISIDDFDLSDALTEAAAFFSKEMRDKGLEFVVEPLHLQVRTDRRRLCQCLLNLLGNAVKFTEQGVIRMTVRLSPAAAGSGVLPGGDLVEIAVADTGIGIREEDIPKLFNAFVRLPLPAHMNVKGTGLGLYLTGKIVREVLGGEIKVESFFGKGSCFTILIPAKWQGRREP